MKLVFDIFFLQAVDTMLVHPVLISRTLFVTGMLTNSCKGTRKGRKLFVVCCFFFCKEDVLTSCFSIQVIYKQLFLVVSVLFRVECWNLNISTTWCTIITCTKYGKILRLNWQLTNKLYFFVKSISKIYLFNLFYILFHSSICTRKV